MNCEVGTATVRLLHENGVKLILLRCAGFNHVDTDKANALGIRVMRVPGYSPEAVEEHAMARICRGFGMEVQVVLADGTVHAYQFGPGFVRECRKAWEETEKFIKKQLHI